MDQNDRYRDTFAKRFNAQGSGSADYSGPLGPGVGREALEEAQLKSVSKPIEQSAPEQMGQRAPASAGASSAPATVPGSATGTAMNTLGQAGMMSGNPYLMAGGLGLQVLAQGEQNKRQQQEAQRQAYNERIKQRQEQMSQIASMGIQ